MTRFFNWSINPWIILVLTVMSAPTVGVGLGDPEGLGEAEGSIVGLGDALGSTVGLGDTDGDALGFGETFILSSSSMSSLSSSSSCFPKLDLATAETSSPPSCSWASAETKNP